MRQMLKEFNLKVPVGYSARPADGEDLKEIVRIANLDAMEMLGIADTDEDEIRNDWENDNFELASDSQVVFSSEGEMLGWAQVYKFSKPAVNPYIQMRMKPGFRDHEVGDFLLDWSEMRSKRLVSEIPKEAKLTARIYKVSGFEPLKVLFERHDFNVTRHSLQMLVEMEAMPEKANWPEGIALVEFDEKRDLEDVYRANDEAFADHFGHIQESFDVGFPQFKHYMLKDSGYFPEMWFVARDRGEIAGLSLCRKYSWEDKDTGWVMDLSVRRPWRRKGLGQALLAHSFREYYKRGFRKVALGVDAASLTGATKLYEAAGMKVARTYDRYEKVLRAGKQLAKTEL